MLRAAVSFHGQSGKYLIEPLAINLFFKTLIIHEIIVSITTTILVQSEVLMHNKMCFHVTDHVSEVQTL